MSDSPPGDRSLAAVAYVLTWLTGIVIFLVAKKTDRYARWHAVQAIGLGIAALVGALLVAMLGSLLRIGGGGVGGAESLLVGGLLALAWWMAVVVLVVVLAINAYKGVRIRLPVIAGFADRYA